MKNITGIAIAALAVSGCATTPGASVATESIVYETGPCFGACPVYRVTVGSDGRGLFEGMRFTPTTGESRFTISPEQYRAFARHLAPLRPAQGDRSYAGEACERTATDLPSADVTWRTSGGEAQHLHFYFGCDMERNRAIAERLRTAPDLLPIEALISRRQ